MGENKLKYEEFELIDGSKVKLTLSFGKLAILRKLNFELYERYSNVNFGKSNDILDIVTIIYVAYWCANFGSDDLMKEEEFTELVPFDLVEIQRTYTALTRPKKK